MKYSKKIGQSHCGLVTRPWTNIANNTAMTTVATHREGWRSRTTRAGSGPAEGVAVP